MPGGQRRRAASSVRRLIVAKKFEMEGGGAPQPRGNHHNLENYGVHSYSSSLRPSASAKITDGGAGLAERVANAKNARNHAGSSVSMDERTKKKAAEQAEYHTAAKTRLLA